MARSKKEYLPASLGEATEALGTWIDPFGPDAHKRIILTEHCIREGLIPEGESISSLAYSGLQYAGISEDSAGIERLVRLTFANLPCLPPDEDGAWIATYAARAAAESRDRSLKERALAEAEAFEPLLLTDWARMNVADEENFPSALRDLRASM